MRCDVCGNDYDKAFQVISGGKQMTFDALECAIQALAPRCGHCECMIIGHGVETDDAIFCCAHCARQAGEGGLKDRVS